MNFFFQIKRGHFRALWYLFIIVRLKLHFKNWKTEWMEINITRDWKNVKQNVCPRVCVTKIMSFWLVEWHATCIILYIRRIVCRFQETKWHTSFRMLYWILHKSEIKTLVGSHAALVINSICHFFWIHC